MEPLTGRRDAPTLGQVVSAATLVNVLTIAILLLSATFSTASEKPIRILAFGDSLTSGYGVRPKDAFPNQLQKALKTRGHNITVINGGVAGDTTAAGLSRFDWTVGDDVDAVILELGANDALRGIEPKVTRDNLQKILAKLQERKLPVLFVGMRSPANWGDTYADDFDAIFPALAKEHGLVFYPFFLEGVVLDAKLNQQDGMHPNAKGVAEIVRQIMPSVEELIGKVQAQRAAAKS